MTKLRDWYGANPLHLLGLLASFALAGYAALRLLPVDFLGVAVWFAGGVVLHDLVLLPLYSLVDRSVARVLPDRVRLNYIRVPLVLSGLMFLVFFPTILGLAGDLESTIGHAPAPFLLNWLLVSAVLFACSGALLVLRLRRMSPPGEEQVL